MVPRGWPRGSPWSSRGTLSGEASPPTAPQRRAERRRIEGRRCRESPSTHQRLQGNDSWRPLETSRCASARSLLDDLVGARNEGWRDREAARARGLEIDDELELGSLLDWQLGRLGPLEDLVDIDGSAPPQVSEIWPVAHQAARHHVLPEEEYGRQPMLQCELGQTLGVIPNGERGRVDDSGVDVTLRHPREGPVVIRDAAHADGHKLDTELPPGFLDGLQERSV